MADCLSTDARAEEAELGKRRDRAGGNRAARRLAQARCVKLGRSCKRLNSPGACCREGLDRSLTVLAVRPNVELTGPLRRDGLARAERMYRVPQAGPRRPAVAGPVVQRGVMPHSCAARGRGLVILRGAPQTRPSLG